VMVQMLHGVLGDLGPCTADFRDQYYGLVPYVREARGGVVAEREAPLITTGLIEPAGSLWGQVSTRFAKQKWAHPVIDLQALAQDRGLTRWAASRMVPKILVATQGSIIEAVVDERGAWLPSVPVLTMAPDPERVWHALAVLLSPPVVAYAAATYAGSGLTMKAIKLSAKQLAALPLPSNREAWDQGAQTAHLAQLAKSTSERSEHLVDTATVMCKAYGSEDPAVLQWWLRRAGLD